MVFSNMQNQKNMNLVLSTDAKPRLKWTQELHERFVQAVSQLGGEYKATPKSLMRVMGIPGLTLYHLKSHLQKYRLGKSQQSETCDVNMQSDYRDDGNGPNGNEICGRELDDLAPNQMTESLQIAKALQMQMEVQRKLHEQIEVQRHLQLRIEAQGKYLHTVLKKAHETLAGCNSSSGEVELARGEISQLVSMINAGSPCSPISELTEAGGSSLKPFERKRRRSTLCSIESSLTSTESLCSEEEEEKLPKDEIGDTFKSNSTIELPLMDMRQKDEPHNATSYQSGRLKGATSPILYAECVEKSSDRGSPLHNGRNNKMRKCETTLMLDLNTHYQDDIETGSNAIDLNI